VRSQEGIAIPPGPEHDVDARRLGDPLNRFDVARIAGLERRPVEIARRVDGRTDRQFGAREIEDGAAALLREHRELLDRSGLIVDQPVAAAFSEQVDEYMLVRQYDTQQF